LKKLLILAYDFPPYVSVGGLRPYNWFLYLKKYGIEPIVITRQWDNQYGNHLDYISAGKSDETIVELSENGTIFRTPYHPNLSNRILLKYGNTKFKIVRKVVSGFFEFAQFIIPTGPKVELYRFARSYLKENKVDAIIATGDPFVLFSYASKLSKEFQIPWIADYRDPWSQNFSSKKGLLQRKFELYFEKRIVKSSELIITVDLLFKLKIASVFPSISINIVPNGFDEDGMLRIKDVKQNSEILTFSFIGTIYDWHPIEQLLEDFYKFCIDNPSKKFILKFYGINIPEKIERLIQTRFQELKNCLQIFPKIPNHELLESLAKDNVLLLFNYYNFTGTKIYDYLGIKRYILLCYKNSAEANQLKDRYYFNSIETDIMPQIDIIDQTKSGEIIMDSDHLINVIFKLHSDFTEFGEVKCTSVNTEIYSRKEQTRILAEIVLNLCLSRIN
jgi:hypothetical protein